MKPIILTAAFAAALLATTTLRVAAQELPAPSLPPLAPGKPSVGFQTVPASPSKRSKPYTVTAQATSQVPPLVTKFTPAGENFVAEMEEDLAIMTRILEKALEQLDEAPAVSKMGIQMMLTGGTRSVRASYLEGFGAHFMIKVNFPVHGAAQPAESKPAPPPDSEWENARRELTKRGGGLGIEWPADTERGLHYDSALVSSLTKSLLKSLSNAAHVRHLKPDEVIAVTVFGSPVSPAAKLKLDVEMKNRSNLPRVETPAPVAGVPADRLTGKLDVYALSDLPGSSRGTVLTLRVKRADLDELGKGELVNGELTSKHVSQHTYLGSGYDVTSPNSWVRDAERAPAAARN